MASVTPGKGQHVLVRALGELAELPWTCVCAGDVTRSPAYVRSVEGAIREAGLSGRITLPGACDEDAVEALYRASSIFVLPSYFESYGMVLTEAMARGLPIVSTTAGAIPQTVPAEAGILVAPGDVAELAKALVSLLGDPPGGRSDAHTRRMTLCAAGHRRARDLPDWDRAAGYLAEAIEALAWAALV
jgi:glycosyltransferase involved in cell wall biosynthesis